MSAPKFGDSFPDGVSYTYVAPSPENKDVTACGIPIKYNASQEFKNKKVILVSVPGAFTPTCTEQHVPTYIQRWADLKAKGVDQVVVTSVNDAWVMSAWGKALGIHDDSIIFASEDDLAYSKSLGWEAGGRPNRYAIVVDHGKITYAERDTVKGSVEHSGADGVLAKL